MKQLKQFLSARGLSCKGCSEKEDFVKLAVANQHVPLVEAANAEAPPPVPPPAADAEEIEQLMAKLKRGGFGNSKFFSANDFDGLSPEEMAEKINGKPGKGKRKSNKGKSNKAQSEGNSESQGTGSSSSTTEKDKSSKKSKKSSKKSDKKTTSNKKTTEPSPKRTRIVDTPVEEETIEL
jgi:cobalamin biosynthesis Mg chelatase CobN